MGPLGELGALFNPGMRHEIEERQAKANRREEEGNARDGDLRIDLASGVAVINLSNGANGGDRAAAQVIPDGSGDADGESAPHDAPTEETDDGSGSQPVAAEAAGAERSARPTGTPSTDDTAAGDTAADDTATGRPAADGPDPDQAAGGADQPGSVRGSRPLTAAQARRLATAARRSAGGDQPTRAATPRPANVQLPSSKASRAAR